MIPINNFIQPSNVLYKRETQAFAFTVLTTFKVKSRKLLLLVNWVCYLITVQEEWFKVNQISFGNFYSVFHWNKTMKYVFKSILLNTEACAFCNQFKRFLRSYVAQNYECNIDIILYSY